MKFANTSGSFPFLASDLHVTTNADGTSITVVDWEEPNDPRKPANWSFTRKWAIVITTSLATFMVSFGSSVYSAATSQLQADFHVSATISRLGISLYVLGFAFGPLVWGPASELYGKARPLWTGYVLFCACQIPCALARNMPTMLAFRFLGGLVGSSILAILGGMYVDFLLHPTERGIATAIFSLASFSSPAAGPIIGNITAWITLIGGVFFGIIAYSVTPETSEGVILRRKAQRLRKDTGNVEYRAQSEYECAGISTFIQKYLTKPPRMLVREPILIFFTIYMSLAYGIIYLTFTMYPLAFVRDRGWSPIKASLPFLGILVGVTVACVLLAVHNICYVSPKFSQTNVHIPERRLPPMILGSVIQPAGIFSFAWTSDPHSPWPPQVLSGLFIGCGTIMVFMSGVVYLIEVYYVHANSALAINTFIRSAFAAAFPLFATNLFVDSGIKVGGSVLGGICLCLVPFPLIFWSQGHRLRSWPRFAILP